MSEPSLPFSDDLLRHRQMMLGLARELVGSAEAEDVVQDAWVQALRRPPGTDENLGGWLLRITRNLALHRGRARLRRREQQRRTWSSSSDERCLDVYAPVICSNGVVYSNACYASKAKATGCVPCGGDAI